MKFAIATALAAMSLAGSAFADGRITATFDSPQSAKTSLVAAHTSWTCNGGACVANAAPDEAFSVDGCKDLAKQFGHVSAYAGDIKSLDAKALERCNKSAANAAVIGTASR